ncbi:hypothetical protein FC093_03125 [Ilyomonas limi]|uniref:peptidylprolyl isomerase n=1 Tax=Ilyomonas limi TaxID=2575867 RepID=A0A4U3L9N4_9BACT|nr:FKBP-type peptidyl-prolyl cis-trans isomerase [Ilyomonas limi]TKK72018.1 hypothetical protein FC093_03125 [Ilyomonas limi]
MLLQNRTVTSIHFTIKEEHGLLLESTSDDKPFSYLQGAGCLPEVIEAAVDAGKVGDEFTLSLTPEEAYGYPDKELIREVSLEDIETNGELLEAGDCIDIGTNDGFNWIIYKIQDDKVYVNANHPWAGKTILVQIKIVKRRSALAAEINKCIALDEELKDIACGPGCRC